MPEVPPPSDSFSRLELERWALGRLEPDRAEALAAARLRDPQLDRRALRVQDEIRAAAAALPPLRLPDPEPWWRRLPRPTPLLVGGLALAAAALVVLPDDAPTDPDGGMVSRGQGMSLELVRLRAGAADAQTGLIRARPGDRIQYTITPDATGYLAVYNLQDDGTLQPYLPSRPVRDGEVVEGAVVLDDYTGSERIFFLLDDEVITDEGVTGAVQRAWRAPLADLDDLPGAATTQRSALIVKEAASGTP
jgi:hypothetical protein